MRCDVCVMSRCSFFRPTKKPRHGPGLNDRLCYLLAASKTVGGCIADDRVFRCVVCNSEQFGSGRLPAELSQTDDGGEAHCGQEIAAWIADDVDQYCDSAGIAYGG